VRSPEELRVVEDRNADEDIVGFKEALEERWRTFVIERFTGARPSEAPLPVNWSWRAHFESFERSRQAVLESHMQKVEQAPEVAKPKKKKIMDFSDVPADSMPAPRERSSNPGGLAIASVKPGSVGEAFFKKHRVRFH
jgi:hypothetical protein